MHGFGCKILACDPEQNPELIQQIDISYTLEEVCATSDIISVHCPLNLKQNTCSTKGPLADEKGVVLLIPQEELS
jgi:D-lactate dehydrogenase